MRTEQEMRELLAAPREEIREAVKAMDDEEMDFYADIVELITFDNVLDFIENNPESPIHFINDHNGQEEIAHAAVIVGPGRICSLCFVFPGTCTLNPVHLGSDGKLHAGTSATGGTFTGISVSFPTFAKERKERVMQCAIDDYNDKMSTPSHFIKDFILF